MTRDDLLSVRKRLYELGEFSARLTGFFGDFVANGAAHVPPGAWQPVPGDVRIAYGRDDSMLISGLLPALPPYLEVTPLAACCTDDIERPAWEVLPPDYGFAVYRILDPRLVMLVARVSKIHNDATKGQRTFDLRFPIEALPEIGVPPVVIDAITENNPQAEAGIPITLVLSADDLPRAMRPPGFPTPAERFVLTFEYGRHVE